jgi:16S rRNA processing protein RimM
VEKASDWVVVGRFGRAHGIKGFISVHSFTDPKDNILSYPGWFAYIDGQWQTIELLEVKPQANKMIALVKGYEQRSLAEQLVNHEIAVKRCNLPALEEGNYYWHDLIGMQVINQENILLGQVVDIIATGANDVLVLSGERKRLIPYLMDKVIQNVSLETKTIKVDWDKDF